MAKKEIKKQLEELQEKLKVLKINEINTDKHFITTKSYTCLLNNGKSITRDKILKNKIIVIC